MLTHYRNLLAQHCSLDFSEEDAEDHWLSMHLHHKHLEKDLGRSVAFSVAVADYLTYQFKEPDEFLIANRQQYHKAKESAVRDPLTGLYNRYYLRDYLQKEIDKAKRYLVSFSVLFVDVDHFKRINDQFGHLAGDKVLQTIAKVLIRCSRASDIVARYGGEEFVVVMSQAVGRSAVEVSERISQKIRQESIRVSSDHDPIQISISAGLATCPSDSMDPDMLLQQADEALYMAKSMGRDRICLYQASEVFHKRAVSL